MRRGTGTTMLVLTLVVLVGLVSATAVLARPRDPLVHTNATSLLPPDGHREVLREGDVVMVREYALNRGGPMVNSGPPQLVFSLDDPERLLATSFMRLLETTVTEDEVTHSVTVLELGASGIRRTLDVQDQVMRQWAPAPVVLPSEVQAGDSWRSSGSVNEFEDFAPVDTYSYDFSASASAPEDPALVAEGCLDITRTEQVGEDLSPSRSETWCPGRGVVAGGTAPVADSPNPTGPVLEHGTDWDPRAWEVDVADLAKTPPMVWASNIAGVATDETLVLAHQTTGDLLFATDGDVDRSVRAHPGGEVVALSGFGDLVVAATTRATVSAYDIRGVWQWEADLQDMVSLPPGLAGDDVVVVDGSGNVTALDARTGEENWSAGLPDQVISSPLGCGSTTVLATTAAELVMLGPDGDELATASLSDRTTQIACGTGGQVYSAGASHLERVGPDGTVLVSEHMHDALVTDVHAFDDVVVTASSRAITAYDGQSLEMLWRLEGDFFDTAMADGTIVALDTGRLLALDLSGREVAVWDTDAGVDGFTAHLLPTAGGVGVISPELQYTRLR